MDFEQGDNTFRVLSSAIIGMEYWIANPEDNKKRMPVRKHMDEKIQIDDLQIDPKTGELDMPKYFWTFVVYNYNAEKIQILHITQATIRKPIKALIKNKKWGSPKDYDIVVTKEGEGIETRYPSVVPNPKEKLDPKIVESYKAMSINLNALYDGNDPFKDGRGEKMAEEVAKKI